MKGYITEELNEFCSSLPCSFAYYVRIKKAIMEDDTLQTIEDLRIQVEGNRKFLQHHLIGYKTFDWLKNYFEQSRRFQGLWQWKI